MSKAFSSDIKRRINANEVKVLYDLPISSRFKPLSDEEKIKFLYKIGLDKLVSSSKLLQNRPLLLITQTSYTPDENLQLLIDALDLFSKESKLSILLIVTGAGPLKK